MKNNVNLSKITEGVSLERYQIDNIRDLLSATAGKVSILRTTMDSGMECFCSGSMKDGAVSLFDDIESRYVQRY